MISEIRRCSGRRVLLLHDRLDVTLGVADDAAVAEGVGHDAGEDADRALGRLVLRGELAQRLPTQQWSVARGDDHGAGRRTGRLDRDPHRVPGPVLRLLDGEHDIGHEGLDVRADLLALVADDGDDPLRLDRLHGGEHVADHRAPTDRVQHLHGLGLHAGAAAGGEHDHGEVVHGGSVSGVDSGPSPMGDQPNCR